MNAPPISSTQQVQAFRSGQAIIDQAIRENRFGECLLYVFAALFVVCGVIVLLCAVWRKDTEQAIVGTVASALFFPAMHQARQIRKENLAIRLLEAPLSHAATAGESAVAIRKAFLEIFGKRG